MINRRIGDTSDLKKLNSVFRARSAFLVREWCTPIRKMIRLLCLLNVLFALATLAIPLMTRELVDSAVERAVGGLWRCGILLALLIVLVRVLSFLSSYMQNKASAAFQIEMRQRVIRELFRKDYPALKPFHSGELVNRLFSDVNVVKEGVTQVLPALLRTAVSFLGAAVILTTMDWRFVPVMLLGSLAWTGLTVAFRKPMKIRHKRMQQAEDVLHAATQEALENIRVVKAGGSELRVGEQLRKHSETLRDAQVRNGKLAVFMKNGVGGVMDVSWLLCYLWGCVKIFRGEFTYGNLAAMIPLVGRIQSPVANAANMLGQLYGIAASAERLQEILDLPEEVDAGSARDFEQIILNHVTFRYDDGEADVLHDLNGEIRKGDLISLAGSSGEGKTSLFQLLLGIYRPTEGRILFVNGENRIPASRGTRNLFAYVPQGNTLFSGTLRDNLTMFAGKASEADLREAVHVACIEDLVNEIGLDTVLGEHGIGLSEGQAQRVAVARALLSKAPVLLLDEATSALDAETEAKMLQNIAEWACHGEIRKTVMIVTHRPAPRKICDRQWKIEGGELKQWAE